LIYNGRRCGGIRHQYHADGPVGRVDNYPALDKGYGGVYTYPIYTSSLRLFTQLTRLVFRKRVGFPVRGPTPAHVCTTRNSSTSTIRRVRRSTSPRFNIQTICNNFAATITSPPAPSLHRCLCPTSLSVLQHSRFLRFSLSLSLVLSVLLRPSSASLSLSFIPPSALVPLVPPSAPPALPTQPRFFHRTKRRGTFEHTHTETLRDYSGAVCTVPSSSILRPQSL
jgi:hypothetical protein